MLQYTLLHLHNLIEQNVAAVINRLDGRKGTRFAVFGCGRYGQKSYEQLRDLYDIEIDCFIDNNPALEGRLICRKPVKIRPWETDKSFGEKYVVFTASSRDNSLEMGVQLRKNNIPYMFVDAVHVSLAWNRIRCVMASLDSDLSKLSYLGVMYYFLTFDDRYIQTIGEQYFAVKPFIKPINEIIADCGAYVGDTLEEYVRRSSSDISKIYAFEPYDRALAALGSRIRRLNEEYALDADTIEVVPYAVGEKSDSQYFSVLGNEFIPSHNGTVQRVLSLDDFFADKPKPTLIKADIEGGETALLSGAKSIITRSTFSNTHTGEICCPLTKLAICIYHSTAEFYTIPEYVLQLNPNYKLAVRNHSNTFQETVLYAY